MWKLYPHPDCESSLLRVHVRGLHYHAYLPCALPLALSRNNVFISVIVIGVLCVFLVFRAQL